MNDVVWLLPSIYLPAFTDKKFVKVSSSSSAERSEGSYSNSRTMNLFCQKLVGMSFWNDELCKCDKNE
jgi:hypothetical protein